MRIFLTALFVFLSTSVFAQTVTKIKFDGMVHMSVPVATRMLEFNVGDAINKKEINDAIKAFFKQGYFTDIWVAVDGGIVTFHFKEKPVISKVALQGWKDDDKDIMDTVVQLKKGTMYDEKKLEAAKKRIIEAINKDGKIDSVVEIQKEILDNGSMKVTFVVNEGEEIIIQHVSYSGVEKLDSDDFDDVIANKEHQFMGWFWGRNSGKMDLKGLEYDNLRIRDYYMQHGYLDSKVDNPFVKVDFDNYTADMSYLIKEGEQYKISGIAFSQSKHVVDKSKLEQLITLKKGEIFNIKTFREDAKKIKTLVADLSYAYVQVVPDLKKDKKKHTVEVIYKIIPGEKVKIRNVIISGNTRTLDRVIRRELYMGPGDYYSLTDLKDSRNSLGRLGYFDANTIEEKRVDNNSMDLVVKVKEAPTGNIQVGGGYGSYGGLLASISVSDRNIWGSGINVGVRLEKSQTSQNYSFNISNPRLNDSDFSGNFSIYKSKYDYNDYSVNTDGLSIGTGHKFTRHISGFLGYGFARNSYEFLNGFDANASSYYGQTFESYSKSSVTTSVSFDDTDDFYLPREGMIIGQSLEFAGTGGDAKFIKSKTTFSKYQGLQDYIGFDAIFRYKARYNHIINNGYIPVAEKFYMGGIGSVRGYQSYSLSTTVKDANGYIRRVGSKQTFSNNLELSLPLVPSAKMRTVAFVDWGFIGDSSLTEISRGGYGLGLEWFSPVGPIQLMFSRPLNDQPDDLTSVFEFTMGQKF